MNDEVLGLGFLVQAPHAGRQKGHQPSLGGGCRCSLAFARRFFQPARLSLDGLLLCSTAASSLSLPWALWHCQPTTSLETLGARLYRYYYAASSNTMEQASEPSRRNPGLLATVLFTCRHASLQLKALLGRARCKWNRLAVSGQQRSARREGSIRVARGDAE